MVAVFVNVRQVEFCREAEIQLAGGKSVFVSDGWFYVYIQFRAVESCFTDFFGIVNAKIV